jgi:hypothetical protein
MNCTLSLTHPYSPGTLGMNSICLPARSCPDILLNLQLRDFGKTPYILTMSCPSYSQGGKSHAVSNNLLLFSVTVRTINNVEALCHREELGLIMTKDPRRYN